MHLYEKGVASGKIQETDDFSDLSDDQKFNKLYEIVNSSAIRSDYTQDRLTRVNGAQAREDEDDDDNVWIIVAISCVLGACVVLGVALGVFCYLKAKDKRE